MPSRKPGRNAAQSAALASLLAPLLSFIMNAGLRESSKETPAVAVVQVAGTLILLAIGLVAGIVALALIGRHGSQGVVGRALAGILICGLGFGVLVFAVVEGLQKGRQSARAAAEITRLTESHRRENEQLLQRSIAGEDVNSKILGSTDRLAEEMRQSAASMPESERAITAALAETVEGIGREFRKKDQPFAALRAAGGVSPSGLTSPQAIRDRLALVEQCEQANRALLAAIPTWPDQLRQRLRARNVAADRVERVVAGFTKEFRADLITAIHGDDGEMVTQMRVVLIVLQGSYGRWRYDRARDTVVFNGPGLVEQYNTANRAISTIAQHQRERQQQFLDARRAKQALSNGPR
jgi:hypothetical protein